MQNAIEKQETLKAEYAINTKKCDERLDELHQQDLAIETCLDEYYDYQVKLKARLDEMYSERIINGVYENLHLYEETKEVVQDDYNELENFLTNKQEEIVSERKSIIKQKENLEHEYMRATNELEEGGAK